MNNYYSDDWSEPELEPEPEIKTKTKDKKINEYKLSDKIYYVTENIKKFKNDNYLFELKVPNFKQLCSFIQSQCSQDKNNQGKNH